MESIYMNIGIAVVWGIGGIAAICLALLALEIIKDVVELFVDLMDGIARKLNGEGNDRR